jgi:RNA polymerase sigma-70 factor (ECF subfamily)
MIASQTISPIPLFPSLTRFLADHIGRLRNALAAILLDGNDRAASETSDEELMDAYAQGDQDAFRTLFDRYAPRLLRGARRRGLSQADAYDAVQQTFVHIHQSLSDFRADAKVRPWIYTIAFNVMRDMGRRLTRQRKLREKVVLAGAGVQSTEATRESYETVQARNALTQLPEAQREVIWLHYYQEMSFAEIAKLLGSREGAIRGRAHRGYEKLRRLLKSANEAREVS